MTLQTERNKRFDEKFGSNVYEQLGFDDFRMIDDEVKAFLTSEVNLTIEQVEKWVGEANGYYHTIDGKEQVYIGKDDLLSFLTTLKK